MSDPSAPRSVLFVNHLNALGGAEKSLLRLLECVDREHLRPVLAAPAGVDLRRAASDLDIPYYPLPLQVLQRSANPLKMVSQGWMLTRAARQMATLARREDASAVHCNSVVAMLAARGLARHWPLVWHARDLRVPRGALSVAAGAASLIIAISRCVADRILEAVPSAASRLVVIYNGINREDALVTRSREEVRREWGIGPTTPLVACVGQLVPWKRQDLFLRAGARLVTQMPDVRLLLVGSDLHGASASYVEALRSLAVHLGISDRVVWAGQRADMADLLAACDVLAHPATEEPLGRVILESLAVGLPVVAANKAGPAEILEHDVSGLLTTPGEAESLAAGVRRVLTDTLLADRLRAGGVRRVRHFLARDAAAQVGEAYAQLWRAQETRGWRWRP